MAAPVPASTLLPLELVDKAIGSRIHIIMKNDKGPVAATLNFQNFIIPSGFFGIGLGKYPKIFDLRFFILFKHCIPSFGANQFYCGAVVDEVRRYLNVKISRHCF